MSAVFSDPASEDQQIHPAQQGEIRPDCLAYRNGEYIKGKSGFWIIGTSAFFERLNIALARRKREKAALMIEQIF